MFERWGPHSSDSHLGHFYGLALPLLMRGLPVEPVQIETAELNRYKTLLLTYDGQKPPTPEFHDTLAAWVKSGGALIVVDDDLDPFHNIREWWNTGAMHYATPRHHLFDKLGLDHDTIGQHKVGEGAVVFVDRAPSRLSRCQGGADRIRIAVQQAMSATGQAWKESPALVLRRGPYIVVAGIGDGSTDAKPVTLRGRFIPLFDAAQPVVKEYPVAPRARGLLVDLDRYPKDFVGVIAAACEVTNEAVAEESITFNAIGQAETDAVVSVMLPRSPKRVMINGEALPANAFDHKDGVLRIRFPNRAETIRVVVWR